MMTISVINIAAICHAANKAYCESHGDDSHREWEELPDELKDSAIQGVKAKLEHPQRTPAESHEGWLAHKRKHGWTYGKKKDFEKKTHPCFLPYDDLPADQKVKDWLFTGVVSAIAQFHAISDGVTLISTPGRFKTGKEA